MDKITNNHTKLRELAAKAKRGEWRAGSGSSLASVDTNVYNVHGHIVAYCPLMEDDSRGWVFWESSSQYIAAASPVVVLALLDDLDRAKAEVERLTAEHKGCLKSWEDL